MTKEQIYDKQIAPLMAKIIKVCKANKIAMIADFALDKNDDEERLKCTTCLIGGPYECEDEMRKAADMLICHGNTTAIAIISGLGVDSAK